MSNNRRGSESSSRGSGSGSDEGGSSDAEEVTQLRARDLFDRFTMGMVQTLEECEHVVDIRSKPAVPATARDIAKWENNHTSKLPGDLKDFYMSTDGLQIMWTILLGQQILPLGWLHVNPLAALKPLKASKASGEGTLSRPAVPASTAVTRKLPAGVEEFLKSTSVADDTLTIKRRRYMPYKAFSLAPCGPYATVALAFTHPTPSIWLVDRSRTWHMIARTFTEYYRLMTLYLGLPEWQYALTSLGPLPDTRRWLHAFVPAHVLLDNARAPEPATQTGELDACSDTAGDRTSVADGFRGTRGQLKEGAEGYSEDMTHQRTSDRQHPALKLVGRHPSHAESQHGARSSSPPSPSFSTVSASTWASSTVATGRTSSRRAQQARGGAATLPRRAVTAAGVPAHGQGNWGVDVAHSSSSGRTNPWATTAAVPGRRARDTERGTGGGRAYRGQRDRASSRLRDNRAASNEADDGRAGKSPSSRAGGTPPPSLTSSPPHAEDTARASSLTPPVMSKINLDTVMRRVRGDTVRPKTTAPATGHTATDASHARTGRFKGDRTARARSKSRPSTSNRSH